MDDLDALFHAHAESLHRYLVRLTGDPDLAADGVQNAFVRAFEQRAARGVERAWLFKVATNDVLMELRSTSRRARLLQSAAHRVPVGDSPRDPHEHVEALERHDLTVRALNMLSAKERSALLMREEGFSQREIAESLGTTTGSVGTLIARAMVKFADALETSGGAS